MFLTNLETEHQKENIMDDETELENFLQKETIRRVRDLEYIKLPRGTSNDEVPAR
jgi:hypothetical protein